MIYVVDGTGPFFDVDYAVSMAGSHCAVVHQLNKSNAFYHRGPDLGSAIKTTGGIADRVFQQVMREEFPPALIPAGARQRPKSSIFLVGHSRGGAALVRVAQMLDEKGVAVEAMFLFDAVDRALFMKSVETVPKNVRRCFHAIRNEGAEVVMTYETELLWSQCKRAKGFQELHDEFKRRGSGSYDQFLVGRSASLAPKWPELAAAIRAWRQKSIGLAGMKVAMRNSFGVSGSDEGLEPSVPFGNCATKFDPRCEETEIAEFACSHGAVGGTPWTTLGKEMAEIDRAGAKQAWSWMASRMSKCDVHAGGIK